MYVRLTLLFLALADVAAAQGYAEPHRGSADRSALMDALRPHAEELYGAPVQFVIGDLRVAGDVGFAAVGVQRPGGGQIDLTATPGWQSGYFMADADNLSGQVLYRKSGGTWVAVYHVFGATDVWWADPRFCPTWGAVIPEVC